VFETARCAAHDKVFQSVRHNTTTAHTMTRLLAMAAGRPLVAGDAEA
jgi:hypothetical protein